MSDVSVTVVIVAYNSLPELRRSVPALLNELQPQDELIVVDNASSDGLADEIAKLAPDARVLLLGQNVGFAGGVNAGAAEARGDLLVLLNPDAVVETGWAEEIRRPWGGCFAAWMGLVLLAGGERINSSGGVLHFAGFGWAGQVDRPSSAAPSSAREVGFLSGACLAIPRELWRQLGGFAEHFFMYCEDVDLSLRVRLLGGKLAVVPGARVDHDYGFLKGEDKWRLLERNRWATVLRTYPGPLFVLVLPALLVTELAVWVVAARGGWVGAKARATVGVLRELPAILRERRAIQASRRIGSSTFAASLTDTLSSPFFGRIGGLPGLQLAMRIYWRSVVRVLNRLDAKVAEPLAAPEARSRSSV
jgi:GT2 family glycosyltransferase